MPLAVKRRSEVEENCALIEPFVQVSILGHMFKVQTKDNHL